MTACSFPDCATFNFDAPKLDPDLVRALAWCRIGGPKTRPHDEAAFYRAEGLGLLAHDPIWRATPQGEGVLIALGLLKPTWEPQRTRITVLWAREPLVGALAQFISAWPEGFRDCWPETFAEGVEKAQASWREWPGEGKRWIFWTAEVEIPRG